MKTKIPNSVGEQIRQLEIEDEYKWDIQRLKEVAVVLLEKIGENNPHFTSMVRNFEFDTTAVMESVENLIQTFDLIDRDIKLMRQRMDRLQIHLTPFSRQCNQINGGEIIAQYLFETDVDLEHIEEILHCTGDCGYLAQYATDKTLLAGLRFMALAMAAEWPISPGRKPDRCRFDPKSKMDYINEVFKEHPNYKVEAIFDEAERRFHEIHPGKHFLTLGHVQKVFKRKIRSVLAVPATVGA